MIQIGAYMVIEHDQRQYITGRVDDVQGSLVFLSDAHRSNPDGTFNTYNPKYYEIFDLEMSDILYVCVIPEEKAKEIQEQVRLYKILNESFPNTKESYLMQVVNKIQEEKRTQPDEPFDPKKAWSELKEKLTNDLVNLENRLSEETQQGDAKILDGNIQSIEDVLSWMNDREITNKK